MTTKEQAGPSKVRLWVTAAALGSLAIVGSLFLRGRADGPHTKVNWRTGMSEEQQLTGFRTRTRLRAPRAVGS
jgi:hypothetical protein